MQASGVMKLGETASASWALSRANGFGILAYVVYLAGLMAAMMGATTLASAVLPEAVAGALGLPIIAGVGVVGVLAMMRWRRWRMRKTQAARGGPVDTPVTFRIEEDALILEQPHALVRVGWPGVSEVLALKAYWVFVVSGMGYCLPRRFFVDAAAERAFIRAVLQRMEPAARERSPKAAAFVQWE